MSTATTTFQKVITIVTPSFEKHFVQYGTMIDSLSRHCTDIDRVNIVLIVERKNEQMFSELLARYPHISSKIILTEQVLKHFGAVEKPIEFLQRVGKFTFQTLKKFGGLLQTDTEWSLVLDSETVFCNDFRICEVLKNYQEKKYVFYTETKPRGELWIKGDAHKVNCNTEAVLGFSIKNFWFMENFHWFYQKSKVQDLLEKRLNRLFWQIIKSPSYGKFDLFENILYYSYLCEFHNEEYDFVDFRLAIEKYLPENISARFALSKLPFSLFGNDYLLNILQPSEIGALSGLFSAFKIPFLRLEPPFFHTEYLKQLRKLPFFIATISSHHQIWLNKKVAVCISGEFRHLVHRVPEQQVRFLKSFLSGVECDVFIHGWPDPSEALIIHELQPKRYLFESPPSVEDLANQVEYQEPLIKEKRDQGSLLMFYSMQKAFELIGDDRENYDYVVRIRPDIFMDRSLKEIMISISDEGDFEPDAIYVPSHFHSKGINDQFAIGRIERMESYFHTFEYTKRNLQKFSFNPEMFLLRNIMEEGRICLVNAPYGLMRHLPMRVADVHHAMEMQKHVWWSRNEEMPLYTDISAFLTEKLRSMEAVMTKQIKKTVYLPYGEGGIIEARNVDYDPMWHCCAFLPINGIKTAFHFQIVDGEITPSEYQSKVMLLFMEGDDFVLSQWRFESGKMANEKLVFAGTSVAAAKKPAKGALDLAWKLNRNLIGGQPLSEKIQIIEYDDRDHANEAVCDGRQDKDFRQEMTDFSASAASLRTVLGEAPQGSATSRILQQMMKPSNFLGALIWKAFFRAFRSSGVSIFIVKKGQIQSPCSEISDGNVIVDAKTDCHVLYGPYINLEAGCYYAEFFFDFASEGEVIIDVRSQENENIACRALALKAGTPLSIEWDLAHRCSNLEIRLFAREGFKGVFNCLLVRKN